MRITFRASYDLPADVVVAHVEGERDSTLLLNARASAEDVAEALTDAVREWADAEWIYVGGVREPHLRAIN